MREQLLHVVSLIHTGLAVAGVAGTALIVGYGRMSARALRRTAPTTPRPLLAAERVTLRRWAQRDLALFVATMVTVVAFSLAFGFPKSDPAVVVVGYAVLLALVAASLAHHFTARCPVCRRHIGFQQSLGLPDTCEVCQTRLHS